MISPKTLSGLKAKGRQIAVIPPELLDARRRVIALIDDFWRYYCSPDDYSYKQVYFDAQTGARSEVFVTARWRDDHHIVSHRDGYTVISLLWDGRFLPLTRRGDQEILLKVATRDVIEQLLAEIKHSVKSGALDGWLQG
jgi:hypothetical protein